MKNKKIIILIISILLLITLAVSTYFIDLKNYKNNTEPKFCIKIINKDATKVTYYGLGYKIIRYVNISPSEPYYNNKGTKIGTWFMKYIPPVEEPKFIDINSFYKVSLTKNKNIKSLPKSYTLKQAETDNCVILTENIINKTVLDNFLNDYNNHTNSFIRIIETTTEGDLLIYDLLYYQEKINLIIDYSRDQYASESAKELSLEKYKYINYFKYKKKTYLVLTNEEINENNFKNGIVFTISK